MTAWMLYACAAGGLAALVAAALDGWAAGRGLPRRWAWAGGLALAVLLPLTAVLRGEATRTEAFVAEVATMEVAELPGVGDGAARGFSGWDRLRAAGADALRRAGAGLDTGVRAARASLSAADPVAPWAWGAATAGLLLWVAGGALRLLRARRGWATAEVEGTPVLLARDTGPAVVGLVRRRVVLPRWVLALPPEERRLLVAHEEEHLAARDPELMAAALLVVAAMPWNAAAWWLLHRLRLAVELDCDARVVRRHPDPVRYGAALLAVGRRRVRAPLPAVAFAAPPGALERRMAALLSPGTQRWPGWVALLAACVAVGGAWALPVPAVGAVDGAMVVRETPSPGAVEGGAVMGEAPSVIRERPAGVIRARPVEGADANAAGTLGRADPDAATPPAATLGRAGSDAAASPAGRFTYEPGGSGGGGTLTRGAGPAPGSVVIGSGDAAQTVAFFSAAPEGVTPPTRVPGTPGDQALALAAARAAPASGAMTGAARGAADVRALTALAGTVTGGPVRWFVADAAGEVVVRGAGSADDAVAAFAGLPPLAVVQAVGGEHVGAAAGVTVLFGRVR